MNASHSSTNSKSGNHDGQVEEKEIKAKSSAWQIKPFTARKVNPKSRIDNGKGKAGGQFNYPRGIAFDHIQQRILVSDHFNHRVQAFNRSDLKHLYSVGSKGRQLDQFQQPMGLCIQPFTNHLLVCDTSNHRIQVLSSSSSTDQDHHHHYQPLYALWKDERSAVKGAFFNPSGVHCASDGSIVVADTWNHRVKLLDASGRFVHTFGKLGRGIQDLFGPHNVCHLDRRFAPSSAASSLLVVADNGRLVMWSADGRQPVSQIAVGGIVYGVGVDLNGFVYMSVGGDEELHVVMIYDPRRSGGHGGRGGKGALLQTLGGKGNAPGEFHLPFGMCVDDTNTLMVADCCNYRVQFFD